MIESSEQIADLAAAMAVAQTTIEGAIKDSSNPHFKSKYADLASVWTAWQKVGPANGLAVMQFPGQCADSRMEMVTLITHSSGQWIKSTLSIPLQKVDAQGYGSATTYARRYALSAAVGIAPEDDDGNAASNPKGAANDAPPPRTKLDGPYTSATALRTAIKGFVHEMQGVGDADELSAFLHSKDSLALIEQVKRDMPQWWHGGPDMPAEFVPLHRQIEIKEYEMAQQIADLARA